jgi:acetyltransferase-like isoleucine patch superfamily enzyme
VNEELMEPSEHTLVIVPREGVNDDVVRVVEWLVNEGEKVANGKPLVVLETTKASFEVAAPTAGHVFFLAKVGDEVAVGAPVAVLTPQPQRPHLGPQQPQAKAEAGEQVVTNKARELLQQHGLSLAPFAALAVVRAADVEAYLAGQDGAAAGRKARLFRGEPLDPDADWDALCDTALHRELQELLGRLRRRMRAKFDRHVATGDLLSDRWELAKDFGFGEGTSVYNDCLILGDVQVGRDCWIGPGTILDGMNAPLKIGDCVDVGAGAHLYTHNTIERALTGRRAPVFKKATTVGNCCFIAPRAILAPGTVLGDHCFVAAGSYVEGNFPAFSYVAGNPARRVGSVEIHGDRARVRLQEHRTDERG